MSGQDNLCDACHVGFKVKAISASGDMLRRHNKCDGCGFQRTFMKGGDRMPERMYQQGWRVVVAAAATAPVGRACRLVG